MKPYFYYQGIEELAQKLKGNENIYLGIRPYGFHAGNATTMIVYPLLVCRELEKLGKTAQFNFYVFLNDWEQDSLDGPNPRLYPFNIMPKFTTWQYMHDPIDKNRLVVDFWKKVIVNNILLVKHYYPKLKVIPVLNSQMKRFKEMKSCIFKTINHPEIITKTLKQYTNKKILSAPAIYSSAVCPHCHAARGVSKVIAEKNYILHDCKNCGKKSNGKYEEFDYWLYHKPLALPRIAVYKIDLCITGSDHFEEGDFAVRQNLFTRYGLKTKSPVTLYASSIYGSDGNVMGKSKGNARLVDLDKLINLVLVNKYKKRITIPEKI